MYMKCCLSCFDESCNFILTFCSLLERKNVTISQNVQMADTYRNLPFSSLTLFSVLIPNTVHVFPITRKLIWNRDLSVQHGMWKDKKKRIKTHFLFGWYFRFTELVSTLCVHLFLGGGVSRGCTPPDPEADTPVSNCMPGYTPPAQVSTISFRFRFR